MNKQTRHFEAKAVSTIIEGVDTITMFVCILPPPTTTVKHAVYQVVTIYKLLFGLQGTFLHPDTRSKNVPFFCFYRS